MIICHNKLFKQGERVHIYKNLVLFAILGSLEENIYSLKLVNVDDKFMILHGISKEHDIVNTELIPTFSFNELLTLFRKLRWQIKKPYHISSKIVKELISLDKEIDGFLTGSFIDNLTPSMFLYNENIKTHKCFEVPTCLWPFLNNLSHMAIRINTFINYMNSENKKVCYPLNMDDIENFLFFNEKSIRLLDSDLKVIRNNSTNNFIIIVDTGADYILLQYNSDY